MIHTCHAIMCASSCPPRHLMCRPCWAMVSPETQAEVYRTVKLRNPKRTDRTWAPWWRAAHQAIYEVVIKDPRRSRPNNPNWSPEDWLAAQMRQADRIEKIE